MLKKIALIALLLLVLSGKAIQAQEASPLTPGIPVSAEIAESGERDVYTFFGISGDRITLNASAAAGSSLDTVLELYDPASQLIAKNDDANQASGKGSQIQITLAADGEYQVIVSAFAGASTGEYELLLTAEGAPVSSSK